MYLMYVDESGDPGLENSPSRYFVLSGLVIHELTWLTTLDALVDFRRRMRSAFGLKLREEIHAAHFINKPGELARISRNDRLSILRHFSDELARFPELSVINVVVDKAGKPPDYDPFAHAWQALIQRFENTIVYRNFHGPNNPDERGMVFVDGQPSKQLTGLLRKMRRHNPIPSQVAGGGYRNIHLKKVIEDPVYRDSRHSLMVQAADLCAFLLYQKLAPNKYMRKSGGANYFSRIDPVLCRVASPRDPQGIVRL